MLDGLIVTKRKPIPVFDIHKIQQKYRDQYHKLRSIIALLREAGMRLGKAIGHPKNSIVLGAKILHVKQWLHPL